MRLYVAFAPMVAVGTLLVATGTLPTFVSQPIVPALQPPAAGPRLPHCVPVEIRAKSQRRASFVSCLHRSAADRPERTHGHGALPGVLRLCSGARDAARAVLQAPRQSEGLQGNKGDGIGPP